MSDLVVWVPKREIAHFWDETPADALEWWTLAVRPKRFELGDFIYFQIGAALVARAKVSEIRADVRTCEATGRVWSGVHLVWRASDFERLETPQPWRVQHTRGYTYYPSAAPASGGQP